jgi:hypothetical protein
MAKKFQVGKCAKTGAIATGTAVNHGLAVAPSAVIILCASTGATDVYVDTVGNATFAVHFGGGGAHVFYWAALV